MAHSVLAAADALFFTKKAPSKKNKWISAEEFREVFTLSQILPGPNLLNLAAYLGFRIVGPWGTILGLLGLTVPGVLMLLMVHHFLGPHQSPNVTTFFRGVSIGSIALFCILIHKISKGLHPGIHTALPKRKTTLRFMLAIIIGTLSLAHAPLVWILLTGMIAGIALEFLIK